MVSLLLADRKKNISVMVVIISFPLIVLLLSTSLLSLSFVLLVLLRYILSLTHSLYLSLLDLTLPNPNSVLG